MPRHEVDDDAVVRCLLDEDLNWRIADGLRHLGVKIKPVQKGTKDTEIIKNLSKFRQRGVWITADQRARREYSVQIMNAGISVAWIDVHNASSLKQGFLVYSFVYAYLGLIQASDVPLYFNVREGAFRGIPAALIDVKRELPRTRGWFDMD